MLEKGHLNLNTLSHDDIENFHLRCCRIALGVSRKAPIIEIYGETGRFPLAIEAIVNAAKYWYRLQDMKNTTPVYKAYTEMKPMKSGDTWDTVIQSLLVRANADHTQSQFHRLNQ